jgi:formate--tetrahydrofolate ligase
VSYSPAAEAKIKMIMDSDVYSKYSICMVKTHLSLSHDPTLKNRPKGFTLPVADILLYQGAEFAVPVAGGIKLMPGTASDAAYRKIDVDVKTGKVKGLF